MEVNGVELEQRGLWIMLADPRQSENRAWTRLRRISFQRVVAFTPSALSSRTSLREGKARTACLG